jgi:GTP-binding protein HflX
LPHTLVAAFRATLEEVVEDDLLLVVADAAHPGLENHILAVSDVLDEIGAAEKDMLTVYNKSDAASAGHMRALQTRRPNAAVISARTEDGLDGLLAAIDPSLADQRKRVLLRIPQSEAGMAARVHRDGRVFAETYKGDSIVMDAEIDSVLEAQLAWFVT